MEFCRTPSEHQGVRPRKVRAAHRSRLHSLCRARALRSARCAVVAVCPTRRGRRAATDARSTPGTPSNVRRRPSRRRATAHVRALPRRLRRASAPLQRAGIVSHASDAEVSHVPQEQRNGTTSQRLLGAPSGTFALGCRCVQARGADQRRALHARGACRSAPRCRRAGQGTCNGALVGRPSRRAERLPHTPRARRHGFSRESRRAPPCARRCSLALRPKVCNCGCLFESK